MTQSLRGMFAVDTGPIFEMVQRSRDGDRLFDAVVNGSITVVTHELAITELKYILCRGVGPDEARQRVAQLLNSGFIEVEQTVNLMDEASMYKCHRSLALPDCFTLALSKSWGLPALFGNLERELITEMNREPFDVEIVFFSDLK
ncbi:TPA: type II toxin-antitoxin system VapC family toxin [Candidatus Bathyarchaeota archaeon]|nr:type II toxin-antitoxin system VapC family toxin [Candidatus Bathyarchaeota archaeon]